MEKNMLLDDETEWSEVAAVFQQNKTIMCCDVQIMQQMMQ